MKNQNQTNISWQAPEFKSYEKNIGWYVTLFSIGILIVGFFIIQKDLFGAITMAIITACVVFFSKQKPEIVNISLSTKGINYGNLHFPYKQLKSFWIVNTQNHKTLNIITTTYVNNLLILELQDQNPDDVKEFLYNFLPEHEENRETFAQRLMHRLKF
jgi:hypothetical protein